jgi:type I restriction enzyme M protein
MLDQETKRRIDTARDILVGKLPNPQSQVEQITIAMIYKFMDDMDKEAMEFGGEPTFFTGDYEKYSWTKIFDPKLGGYEMLALYGEAIVKLNQNPNIPQLFRDIFKNAYLPYRDPETLKMFLKVINEFHYDHSEKLGDAFEYLLSVLGSQGDAGQFRTPRHIIDFMVAIMQPKKDESICDPACGTAGFLISSYKHILNQNTKKNKGDLLTPDERKKLINNFVGYDISSEMVRLSLVNMYLHGFTTPKIYEYDTLTYTDRWGDTFDIIMANPPFMTPKGGIRPHKKFAMQANRSEVLFVDYIMEHINPTTGRAAVIVPEGIIFQSATAYKALRKLLIENNFLYGVVSLPAGIFQPYSGVKTSILLLDKTLAKKTDKILFVKIENDGYSLGAQRKELSTSDLPDATNFIKQYITAIRNDDFSQFDFEHLPLNSIAVEKNRITENGDYNLSGERYRVNLVLRNKRFEWVCLGDIANISAGNSAPQGDEYFDNGTQYPQGQL